MRHVRICGIDIYYNLLPLAVLIIMHQCGCLFEYSAFITAIILHEAGHLTYAGLRGMRVERITVYPVGLTARIRDWNRIPVCDRIGLLACGPGANVAAAVLLHACGLAGYRITQLFVEANVVVAVFNLLPFSPLDGGRVLWVLISGKTGKSKGAKMAAAISAVFSSALIALGFMQPVNSLTGVNLVFVGILLMVTAYREYRAVSIMNLRDLLYKKEKFLKKGVYDTREVVVMKSVPIKNLIKNLDHDRYHFISVMDERLGVICRITEEELLRGMLKCGIDTQVGEMVKQLTIDKGSL